MTLVRAALVFAEDRWRPNHAFVVQGGRILATGEPDELTERHPDQEREDWGNVAVLPGTVNAHGHSIRSLLRGIGDDLSFEAWRDRVLFPYTEALDRDAIRTAALFAFTEMAKAGITTAVDSFSLHDRGIENDLAVVEAARAVGIRLVLARSMSDWAGAPSRYRETISGATRTFRELEAALRGDRMAFVHPAPHSIQGASPDMIREGAALASEFGVPFHLHVAARRSDREGTVEQAALSPIRYLDSLGVLSDRALLVHCVWVDADEVAIMEERSVTVVHTPSANAFQGDGVAPIRAMLERGVPVCLGTDGGCTNSRQSVFEEMRMAALVARARDADGSALSAGQALLMGTSRGGAALGLPVGRIAPDHAADLVVVDLDALSVQPSQTAPNQIVFAMQPEAIARVVVSGETIVERGVPSRVDEREIVAKVRQVAASFPPLQDAAARIGPWGMDARAEPPATVAR